METVHKHIKKGFYYHYKHDPNGEWNKGLYEILNVGHHTEIDGLDESAMVAYRPLHPDAPVYKAGKHWDFKPFDVFMEKTVKDGQTVDRYTLITDAELIEKCKNIAEELYKE